MQPPTRWDPLYVQDLGNSPSYPRALFAKLPPYQNSITVLAGNDGDCSPIHLESTGLEETVLEEDQHEHLCQAVKTERGGVLKKQTLPDGTFVSLYVPDCALMIGIFSCCPDDACHKLVPIVTKNDRNPGYLKFLKPPPKGVFCCCFTLHWAKSRWQELLRSAIFILLVNPLTNKERR